MLRKEILSQYNDYMRREGVSYQEMFRKIKNTLIAQRKVIRAAGRDTGDPMKLSRDKVNDISHKLVAGMRVSRSFRLKTEPNEVRLQIVREITDLLVAEDKKGKWVPVPGVLKALGGPKVTFAFGGQDRTIDLASVHVIQLARVPASASASAMGRLLGRDGSVVPFAAVSVAGSRMSLTAPGLQAGSANLSEVAEIKFGAQRCVYLSDLSPAKVTQVGLFDVAFPVRHDRSAAGGPIRLGGQSYAKGLGLHSRCELSYDLGGKFATFAATAGIDAAGGNRGNATLEILGDGRGLIKPLALAAGDKPADVRCGVAGVKTLTILVDFGPDGVDVGDHVSLAEARLIKP